MTSGDSAWVKNLGLVAGQVERWSAESPNTIAVRALAYLQSLPAVAHAGIVSGTTSVWENFKNGYT